MVMYFLSEFGQVVCGCGDSNVNGLSDVGQVSCKICWCINVFVQVQENVVLVSVFVIFIVVVLVIDKVVLWLKVEVRFVVVQCQDCDVVCKVWQVCFNELFGKNCMLCLWCCV